MVNINYSLVGSNGDTIVFDETNFVLNSGMTGFGIAPTEVRIAQSANEGGIWRYTKRGVRDVDLPITILGTDREDVQSKLRRLARLTQDKKGPTELVADYENDESLKLVLHYTGGAESQWGESAGMTWCTWLMSFQAPMPFWESSTEQTFSVTSDNRGRGLLPQLSKLKITNSENLGTVNIESTADVDVFPTWIIQGPITGLVISNGLQSFGFNRTIASGEIITLDTEFGTVIDQDGDNLYSILNPAPKLFTFAPGDTTIEVSGTDVNSETLIRCNYALRFEVVH
jgi:phage-related protein